MSEQLISFQDYSGFYVEAEKEQQALAMLYGTNPTDAARRHGIAEYIEVTLKKGRDKGKSIKIQIRDILKAHQAYSERIDNAQTKYEPDLICLNQIAPDRAEKFKTWLLEGTYTTRYEAIVAPEQLEWLDIITRMVVTHHIMECKYRGYALFGRRTFADKEVAKDMTRLKLASAPISHVAQGANHVVKVRNSGGNVDEEIKKLRSDITDDIDAKVRSILSDSPPPSIEQYRKEMRQIEGQAVNE